MTNTELRIEYVPLDEIEGAESNPKRHHEDLSSSISRFGFADAPIIDDRTGRLVAGHGRIEQLHAMKRKGEAAPEGIDEAGEHWLVPVQRGWSSRSDAEASAFLLAHNKIGEAGGWDQDELSKLLQEIGLENAQFLGFVDAELARLIDGVAPNDADAPDEFDEVDDPKTEHTCPKCGYDF